MRRQDKPPRTKPQKPHSPQGEWWQDKRWFHQPHTLPFEVVLIRLNKIFSEVYRPKIVAAVEESLVFGFSRPFSLWSDE